MADDIGMLEALWWDEANIWVVGIPAWHTGLWVLETEAGIVALVLGTISVDVLDETVGGGAFG